MNLVTRLRSTLFRVMTSERTLERSRRKAREARLKSGKAPIVHYFHQVDDPYSHLTVQKLPALKDRYDLAFEHHLVSAPTADYRGRDASYDPWALKDAQRIAQAYGTEFAPTVEQPPSPAVAWANAELAEHLNTDGFAEHALIVGTRLWGNEAGTGADNAADAVVAQGNALREALGHYLGAMFYFEGEWFWGIDRIRSLELRLIEEGFGDRTADLCVPQPTAESATFDASDVLLEYFPSLRSPYTAIGHARVLELIERTGVPVKVRPVMPMLMRGVPAPRPKQKYIAMDSGREGREFGTAMGKIVDPFGEPVKRAFALFPAAIEQDRALDFVTSYLQAAWFDGVDITGDRGLRVVVEQAGMDWDAAQTTAAQGGWESVLQENLELMLSHDLWGVPSFRVTSADRPDAYACWGQDRIWRVEIEIAQRAKSG